MKVVLEVRLRNGAAAIAWRAPDLPAGFDWFGSLRDAPAQLKDPRFVPDVHLWRADGGWREDGSAHPLDIMEFCRAVE